MAQRLEHPTVAANTRGGRIKLTPKDAPSERQDALTAREEAVLAEARTILARLVARQSDPLSSPTLVKNYLMHHLATLPHEVFGILHLDSQKRLIRDEPLFRGTVNGAAVYPREVVKAALANNTACVVLYHNHPGGTASASVEDQRLTSELSIALATVGIQTLDHIIVAGTDTFSFAEHGLMVPPQH